MELVTSSWWAFRWGALLRNENKKRLYFGYFKESSVWQRFKVFFAKIFWTVCYEPEVELVNGGNKKQLFIFKKVIVDEDLFKHIRTHRTFIQHELHCLLNPSLLARLEQYPAPEIGIHIRRGDFKYGNPITPLSFFIDAIKMVWETTKSRLKVTVFTDAKRDEIEEIFSLPGVSMSDIKPDILDILLMSRSKVLILSRSSTFSYWAAFLSNAIVIRPINDWQPLINSNNENSGYFEILWSKEDENSTGYLERKLVHLS
jgi:hypothetical protein